MLITSPGYMQTRSLEAGMGGLMFISGAMFALPGMIDTSGPAYAHLREATPAWLTSFSGGMLLIVLALLRWTALAINSHHRSTPLFRLAGCAVGCGFWFTVAIGFYRADLSATPWICGITSWIAAQEAYSGFRTGFDSDALDSLGIRAWLHARRKRGHS